MSVSSVAAPSLLQAALTSQPNPVSSNKQGDQQRTAPEEKLASSNAAAVRTPGRLNITA
jgi:hypothetical protein